MVLSNTCSLNTNTAVLQINRTMPFSMKQFIYFFQFLIRDNQHIDFQCLFEAVLHFCINEAAASMEYVQSVMELT